MSKRTRRQFLEDSMLTAAAAVAATSAVSQPSEAAQSTSPNEKLGVAVIGVRGRGGSHISAFAGRKDTEVVTICDVDSEIAHRRAGEVAKRQSRKPEVVSDLRKVMEDPRVDIVSIATPNHWHALASIWAIQAGKDVYVEKPVSHNVSEGRRIVQAARKYQKICQTGTQCRSNPGMIEAMEYVRSGKLGQVQVARGLCFKPRGPIGDRGQYKPPGTVDYNLWLGPAPDSPLTRPKLHYDWHWQWDYGNGDLGNQGIHQMDLARWGLGVNRLSDSVISYGGRFGYEDAGETANTQTVIHQYGEQALVFEVRGLKTAPYRGAKIGVIFHGSEGYLVMTSYDSGAAFDLDGKMIRQFKGGGNHFGNFLDAVRSRHVDDLTADIEEGHLSSALCHLGNISYRLGSELAAGEAVERLEGLKTAENVRESLDRTTKHLKENGVNLARQPMRMGLHLKLDPANETFVGHAEANEMLTRPYREPFVVPAAGAV